MTIRTLRAAGFAAAAFLFSIHNAAALQGVKVSAAPAETPAATAAAPAAPAPALLPVAVAASLAPTPVQAPPASTFTQPRPASPAYGVPPLLAAPTSSSAVRPLADLVAEHRGMTIPDEQFDCLASAVYFESGAEPLEGQLAVAEVVLNRVRSGLFRGTICDVVRQPRQFSFVRRGGVIPQARRETGTWARAVAIAHIALNNLADSIGDDSLFFHATYVSPNWGRPRIAQIGRHIFYR